MSNLNKALGAALLAGLMVTGSACEPMTTLTKAQLDELRMIHNTCPAEGRAYFAGFRADGSGSSRSEEIVSSRMAVAEKVVTKTAVCSGSIRMTVFADSSVDVKPFYSADLRPEGATLNARLRKVPAMVAEAMPEVKDGYVEQMAKLNNKGSDVIAQFGAGAEDIGQRGDVDADLYIATDGFQTGVDYGALLGADAKGAALSFPAVSLPPTTRVTVFGVGIVASERKPTTAKVDAAKKLLQAYCADSGAGDCRIVTDYTS